MTTAYFVVIDDRHYGYGCFLVPCSDYTDAQSFVTEFRQHELTNETLPIVDLGSDRPTTVFHLSGSDVDTTAETTLYARLLMKTGAVTTLAIAGPFVDPVELQQAVQDRQKLCDSLEYDTVNYQTFRGPVILPRDVWEQFKKHSLALTKPSEEGSLFPGMLSNTTITLPIVSR